MSTEYSQAVRDVVRAIGECGPMDGLAMNCHRHSAAMSAELKSLVIYNRGSSFYLLTDKGRELLREMRGEELEEVAARSDKHEFRAQVSGHAVFKSAEIALRSTDGALFNDRTFPSREYNVTLTPVDAEPTPEPAPEPERLYPMGKQQPAQIDCRREYCKYHMYGRCTNPAPAITLNGPPSMTNEKGVCWSHKDREPEPEPEPTPDPLCPVCGKPASEHKSGLFWGYKGHTNKSGIWMGRILARLCRTGQQQGVAARNHPAHQAMRGAAMTDRLSDRR